MIRADFCRIKNFSCCTEHCHRVARSGACCGQFLSQRLNKRQLLKLRRLPRCRRVLPHCQQIIIIAYVEQRKAAPVTRQPEFEGFQHLTDIRAYRKIVLDATAVSVSVETLQLLIVLFNFLFQLSQQGTFADYARAKKHDYVAAFLSHLIVAFPKIIARIRSVGELFDAEYLLFCQFVICLCIGMLISFVNCPTMALLFGGFCFVITMICFFSFFMRVISAARNLFNRFFVKLQQLDG